MQSGGNELSKRFIDYVSQNYAHTPVVTLSVFLENEIVRARIESGEKAGLEIMELYGL